MLVVSVAFGIAHVVVLELAARFGESGGFSLVADDAGLEVAHPFFHGRDGHFVEVVDADEVVGGEHFFGRLLHDGVALSGAYLEFVLGVDAHEVVLPAIDVVRACAEVEVDDADGVDLLDFLVGLPEVDVLGDGFRHAVKHSLKVEGLGSILHFDENDFALAVACLDVHAVELVVGIFLVSLAFENFHDFYFLAEKHGEKSFQYVEVRLLPQQPLHGPVKAYVFVFQCTHNVKAFAVSANVWKISEIVKCCLDSHALSLKLPCRA